MDLHGGARYTHGRAEDDQDGDDHHGQIEDVREAETQNTDRESMASRVGTGNTGTGNLFFGTQRRRSHFFPPRPLPYFPCLLSRLVSSHLLRDSLCIALQTEKLWI